MADKLEVVQLGNPILLTRAEEVMDVNNPALQTLIDDMIFTCQQSNGVGIAAPQVGHSLRLMIIASKSNDRYPHAPDMEPLALINPIVVSSSTTDPKVEDWEGCLSIPGIRGLVPRHKWIMVSFINRSGEKEVRRFEDFIARIFQHEHDHLNGMVFLDRVRTKGLATQQEWERITGR